MIPVSHNTMHSVTQTWIDRLPVSDDTHLLWKASDSEILVLTQLWTTYRVSGMSRDEATDASYKDWLFLMKE